ncbi:MAG: IS200/IS605 family transposase [Anaerolineae bacterium]
MPFYQLFYHLIWATKNREPLLLPDVESVILGFLRSKATGLGGVVFALNCVVDHVHMVVAIPPSIAVARFVGQVKAVASTRFNKLQMGNAFFWQEEYGAFSFDGKRLPHYIAYVEHQKEHHARGTTIPILERTSGEGVVRLKESSGLYLVAEAAWRAELESLAVED